MKAVSYLSDCFWPEADLFDMELGRLGRFSLAYCIFYMYVVNSISGFNMMLNTSPEMI